MKKVLSVLFAILMLLSMVSVSSAEETVVDLSVWGTNNGFLPVEKGSPLYEKYLEITGVGVTQPYVEWNGGTTYNEQLNLKIAAGEMPDMFNPNGMETTLIKSGALLDLTPYLEKYAPNLYNLIGEEVWGSVRANVVVRCPRSHRARQRSYQSQQSLYFHHHCRCSFSVVSSFLFSS